MTEVSDVPSTVAAEAGEVIVEGPAGAIYYLTPDAAANTSDRLFAAAAKAAGQRAQAAQRKGNPFQH